jgi:hypothetical protein
MSLQDKGKDKIEEEEEEEEQEDKSKYFITSLDNFNEGILKRKQTRATLFQHNDGYDNNDQKTGFIYNIDVILAYLYDKRQRRSAFIVNAYLDDLHKRGIKQRKYGKENKFNVTYQHMSYIALIVLIMSLIFYVTFRAAGMVLFESVLFSFIFLSIGELPMFLLVVYLKLRETKDSIFNVLIIFTSIVTHMFIRTTKCLFTCTCFAIVNIQKLCCSYILYYICCRYSCFLRCGQFLDRIKRGGGVRNLLYKKTSVDIIDNDTEYNSNDINSFMGQEMTTYNDEEGRGGIMEEGPIINAKMRVNSFKKDNNETDDLLIIESVPIHIEKIE